MADVSLSSWRLDGDLDLDRRLVSGAAVDDSLSPLRLDGDLDLDLDRRSLSRSLRVSFSSRYMMRGVLRFVSDHFTPRRRPPIRYWSIACSAASASW